MDQISVLLAPLTTWLGAPKSPELRLQLLIRLSALKANSSDAEGLAWLDRLPARRTVGGGAARDGWQSNV